MKKIIYNYNCKTGKTEIVEVELTQQEIENNRLAKEEFDKKTRIAELLKLLKDTDYKCLKYAEGELTEEEYEPIKLQRRQWRNEINELQGGENGTQN